MDRQGWEAVVREREFRKWKAEDESGQLNRLQIPATAVFWMPACPRIQS